jgi:molecular chaperone HscB
MDGCRSRRVYNRAMADVDDPFAVFGLPRQFELSRSQLQVAYLNRTARLHPDRFTEPIQQAEAAQESARINDARTLLADDEKRANALLRLLGGPSKEQDKSLPDGFLMEMMDVRQAMDQAMQSNDPVERKRFEDWAQQQRDHHRQAVSRLFTQLQRHPSSSMPKELLSEIRLNLNAWRYIERMIEQLDPDYNIQS